MSVEAKIRAQHGLRAADPARPRIKVNLYTADEVAGVALAVRDLAAEGLEAGLDCLMVGDSYLMTHLARPSTALASAEEQARFLTTMEGLVRAVRAARDRHLGGPQAPWLMADMPDGSTAGGLARALANMARLVAAGAETVKLELGDDTALRILEAAARDGLVMIGHIGYAPQHNRNRRYGASLAEAWDLFAQARRARDAGARALVVERVSTAVNRALCRPHPQAIPIYAIFSGPAPHGGQNLNVWDAVIRPGFAAHGFPPTATLDRAAYPQGYTVEVIRVHFARLLRLTRGGHFPPPERSPPPDEVVAAIEACDPWTAPAGGA